METYVACCDIRLPKVDFNLSEGDVIRFDGNSKAIIGEEEYHLPRLTGAIERGWLKDPNKQGEDVRPPSAEIEMRKPNPQGEATTPHNDVRSGAHERVVGSVSDRKSGEDSKRTKQAINQQEEQVEGVRFSKPAKNEKTKVTRSTKVSTTTAPRSAVSQQAREGARQEPSETSEDRARKAREMREAQNRQNAQEGQSSQGTAYPGQNIESVGTIEGGESRVRASGIEFDNEGISDRAAQSGGATARVSREQAQQNQARENLPQQPSRPENRTAEKTARRPEKQVEAESTPKTLHPEPEQAEPNAEVPEEYDLETREGRLAILKTALPSLSWDFKTNWRRKLKLLEEKDYSDLEIRAICAAESDNMQKHIRDQFSDAFDV